MTYNTLLSFSDIKQILEQDIAQVTETICTNVTTSEEYWNARGKLQGLKNALASIEDAISHQENNERRG